MKITLSIFCVNVSSSNNLRFISSYLGNDVEIEGYYVFEDNTELDWVSNWNIMSGASQDGILFNTEINVHAGSWTDEPISYIWPYICEKNDQ